MYRKCLIKMFENKIKERNSSILILQNHIKFLIFNVHAFLKLEYSYSPHTHLPVMTEPLNAQNAIRLARRTVRIYRRRSKSNYFVFRSDKNEKICQNLKIISSKIEIFLIIWAWEFCWIFNCRQTTPNYVDSQLTC